MNIFKFLLESNPQMLPASGFRDISTEGNADYLEYIDAKTTLPFSGTAGAFYAGMRCSGQRFS
jgi:hypothetical protein